MKSRHESPPVQVEIANVPKGEKEAIFRNSKNHSPIQQHYEHRRWPYLLSLPFMHILTLYVIAKKKIFNIFGFPGPGINTLWFDGLGLECRKVKEYATTWKAMHIIYNHPFPKKWTIRGLVDEFYWNAMNCPALRNRQKLIKQELRSAISQINDDGGDIRIVSLACGSGEVPIEIIAEYKEKGKTVKALFVDIDAEALERAGLLARHYGVDNQIDLCNMSAHNVSEICREFQPHIIEMLGLFDYLDQDEAIVLTGKIRESIDTNSFFLTSNISPNIEQHFLKWVINWPMVYRNPGDIDDIALKSGFRDYRIIYEPLMIHGLLIAQK